MSLSVVRAAIVAAMNTVPEIGVVQPFERYAHDLAKLKQLYFSATHQQLRGWYVRRLTTSENGILPPRYLEAVTWRIQGFMALDDAASSELVMDELIESLRAVFRADRTLGGTVTKTGRLQPNAERGLQLVDSGPVLFGGVLCHGARFTILTTRELNQ